MSCQNNLKQLAIAAHNFHTTYGNLPPGYLGPYPLNEQTGSGDLTIQWVGVIAFLLPYIEQDNIYKQLVVNWDLRSTGQNWWLNSTNWTLAHTKIKMLVCPSSDPYAWTQGVGVASHFFNYGTSPSGIGYYAPSFDDTIAPGSSTLGLTMYGACMGTFGKGTNPFWNQWVGPFFNRSAVSLSQIRDGTSNTLMFSEGLASRSAVGPPDYGGSWLGFGGLPTVGGLWANGAAVGPEWYQLSSRHSGVVQVAFCDGGVRGVKPGGSGWLLSGPMGPDWFLLQQMAGTQDGGIQDISTLVN
jgi:prepilin-type processing-associated H-X9-DG protein